MTTTMEATIVAKCTRCKARPAAVCLECLPALAAEAAQAQSVACDNILLVAALEAVLQSQTDQQRGEACAMAQAILRRVHGDQQKGGPNVGG